MLDDLKLPEDLKNLSYNKLEILAEEIRALLIKTISKNGGHLAPNLGVVELTLALHKVFTSPYDKIIWDVGHQSYVHKIVTGRLSNFSTLRQLGGISGFPKPEESPHDIFATGHSSTSISVGLGLAKARDLIGEKYKVVSVIGDGSLTGGMAFEALNYTGHLKTNLIVILNDNEMSIAPNVGALSNYLSRLRMNPMVYKLKEELQQLIQKIPKVGETTFRYLDKIKDSLKYLVIPGILFEELGFTYFGPVDGHNLRQLSQALLDASEHKGPILVHVLTKKGKGYKPAEDDPSKFHGVSGFEISTGYLPFKPGPPTYTEVFGKTLVEVASHDERIVAITAAMTEGAGLKEFSQRFPNRFFDVGIAEGHAVTMAGGLARAGMKPVVAIYSTFLQRAFDQILHDVCLQGLPVIFALDRAGVVGEDGPTHHGVFDLSYLRMIPGITIMAPKDENELRQMLLLAVDMDKPVAIRYPRGQGRGIKLSLQPTFRLGEAEVLREGEHVALLALGPMVHIAEKAAELLTQVGIYSTVINCRFIKPLDQQTILYWARRVPHIITVEDHVLTGGFGSAVLELLAEAGIRKLQISRLGYPDRFIESGTIQELQALYGLNEEGIYQVVTGRLLTLAGVDARK
ncbi:MAG TPA: 1-deoxy-D-xylulose-5-phosphate synthase [Firmicutes bacterium]|nr:1-deoxy-D-xylulose-5-phosphate synthase [Bacillota bacterium]HBK69822.1 1-deoxy-D-xylulose-5-phosphate synthase [Bacillota bacterium]HBT15834.1 1-deoxy-D-xylulose-5-phosphate synthase [Bacillota bacterium]